MAMTDRDAALMRAIQKAGGPKLLAAALDKCTAQAVSQWKQTPVRRVLEIERLTGVPRQELRPDIYPIGLAQ